VTGVLEAIRLQILKSLALDSNVRVTAAIAYSVASKLDGHFSAIANSFPFAALRDREKEFVRSVRREERKEAPVPQILNVRLSSCFPPSSGKLGDVQLIF